MGKSPPDAQAESPHVSTSAAKRLKMLRSLALICPTPSAGAPAPEPRAR